MNKTYIYYHLINDEKESHALTRKGLEKYLKETGLRSKNVDPCISRDEKYAKPYFKEYPQIYHNTSHSGKWWACAYGLTENGLDLQKENQARTEKIAKRFFHPDEIAWLQEKNREQFFRLWAYNESYLKYTGMGLRKGLSYFSVVKEDGLGVEGVYQEEISFPEEGYWLVLTTKEREKVVIQSLFDD